MADTLEPAGEAGRPQGFDRPAELVVPVRTRRAVGWLIGGCLAAEVAFVVLDYFVNFGRATHISAIRVLFNIASEEGLASWFSSAETLVIALTLWAIRFCSMSDPGASKASRRGWLVLALLFTWMAFDDGAQIHERVGTAVEELAKSALKAGAGPSWAEQVFAVFPSYVWQIVVLPGLAAAAALGFLLVWRELGARRLRLLVLAGLGCLALAVVLDFFEGLDADHPWNLYTPLARYLDFEPWTLLRFGRSAYDTIEHASKSIEEYLEMLGNTLIWLAFLKYLTGLTDALRIRFR